MRTYRDIVRENVLTFINVAIFILGVGLILLGEVGSGLISMGVVGVNIVVNVAQEMRAKIVLERIALLVRPTARVVRDGTEVPVAAVELRVGDVVRIVAGDQILADATIRDGGSIEVDESLLTGESAAVAKGTGDELLAGSFCVSGTTLAGVVRVGETMLVSRMTAGARAFRRTTTPLQRRVDTIIRGVLMIALSLAIVVIGSTFVEQAPLVTGVARAMVIAGLVPNGLLLAVSAAYAMSAVRVARRGVLVQQANAIDTLGDVDVLCTDKTGTLTTSRTRLARLVPLEGETEVVTALLATFAASTQTPDRVIDAVRDTRPASAAPTLSAVPFSAARGWSAVSFSDLGTLVLGAPERLTGYLATPIDEAALQRLTAEGLRVMLFGRAEGISQGAPMALRPLGFVCLSEELRADARETLGRLAAAGIAVKIVSGDHPSTVRAIADAAGVGVDGVATGGGGEACDEDALARLAATTTIFGRITPEPKQRIVRALRTGGRYVAMVGDGVNDVLALKAADLGIAMRSGASSARAVADVVLLTDEIGTLVPAAEEGRRILRGMRDILRIFLTRVLYASLLISAVSMIEGGFPFTPAQNALLTLLTVGVPSLALAAWPGVRPVSPGDLDVGLALLVIPPGWTIAIIAFFAYLVHASDVRVAQTALTTLAVFCGVLLYIDAPERDDAGGRHVRHLLVGGTMVAPYLWILGTHAAVMFDLAPLPPAEVALSGAVALVWIVILRWLWLRRALEMALGLSGAA